MRRPYGKINIIGLLLILGVAAVIYSIVIFSTPFLDNLDVKEHVAAAYNQAAGMNDDALKRFIENKTTQLGTHEEEDGYGNVRTVPGLGLKDEDITIERNEVARTILIRVDYQRKVILKPTSRIYWMKLKAQTSGPIRNF